MTATTTNPKITPTAANRPEPRKLATLLADYRGSASFYAPLTAEPKAVWDQLRAEYDTVIKPDQHSEHYVRLQFEVEGVPVSVLFHRKDVGVLTTVTAERYTIEGELTA